jgi:hypothetical protein
MSISHVVHKGASPIMTPHVVSCVHDVTILNIGYRNTQYKKIIPCGLGFVIDIIHLHCNKTLRWHAMSVFISPNVPPTHTSIK